MINPFLLKQQKIQKTPNWKLLSYFNIVLFSSFYFHFISKYWSKHSRTFNSTFFPYFIVLVRETSTLLLAKFPISAFHRTFYPIPAYNVSLFGTTSATCSACWFQFHTQFLIQRLVQTHTQCAGSNSRMCSSLSLH